MISIYKIKPKFQQLLLPILKMLYEAKVSANMITWSAILLSLATGILIWMHPYGLVFVLLPISLLFRMALNALDGMMARNYQMQSAKGEILNELGDVISDFVLFFPLLKLFGVNSYILITFLFLSIINEIAGILGKIVSGTRRYDGPMGKSDRALIIGLLSIIFYFTTFLNVYIDYIFIFIILLLIISTYFRINNSLKSK
jgi:CDP-diacylglycerol--glycerol-3-phosphate 3-phosphatidyltransferase